MAKLPTTTIHQARLQVYQPTRRPTYLVRTVETAWGKATITGKIGQGHADIVEALFYHAIDTKPMENGAILLLIDPQHLRKSIGGGKRYSGDATWTMLQSLRDVRIDIDAPLRGLRAIGGVIDLVEESKATVTAKNGKTRQLWRVTVNAAFAYLMKEDLPISYDPESLAKLSHGVSQAIARLVLTHKNQPNQGWRLDELISAVGADSIRDRRREVHADCEKLAEIGIIINGDRVLKS